MRLRKGRREKAKVAFYKKKNGTTEIVFCVLMPSSVFFLGHPTTKYQRKKKVKGRRKRKRKRKEILWQLWSIFLAYIYINIYFPIIQFCTQIKREREKVFRFHELCFNFSFSILGLYYFIILTKKKLTVTKVYQPHPHAR